MNIISVPLTKIQPMLMIETNMHPDMFTMLVPTQMFLLANLKSVEADSKNKLARQDIMCLPKKRFLSEGFTHCEHY